MGTGAHPNGARAQEVREDPPDLGQAEQGAPRARNRRKRSGAELLFIAARRSSAILRFFLRSCGGFWFAGLFCCLFLLFVSMCGCVFVCSFVCFFVWLCACVFGCLSVGLVGFQSERQSFCQMVKGLLVVGLGIHHFDRVAYISS